MAGRYRVNGHLVGYRLDEQAVARAEAEGDRAPAPGDRLRLPALQPLPAHDRAREHLLGAGQGARRPEGRGRTQAQSSCSRGSGSPEKRDVYPAQLSGGQQQRVAIARALAMKPDADALRRADLALDPEMVGEVLEVMRELAARRDDDGRRLARDGLRARRPPTAS